MDDADKNCLTYWFPKIREAGLPVPLTHMASMPEDAAMDLWTKFDNKPCNGRFDAWVEMLKPAAETIGFPLFLRSGHTSGKHEWKNTCFVPSVEQLGPHIAQICYFSECMSMGGELSWSKWALREFLPTEPVGICPGYDDMPICKEFRFFVDGGQVKCFHPYWPVLSLVRGGAAISIEAYADLCEIDDDYDELIDLAEKAGRAVGGAWSIDFLHTKRGWILTDMALAQQSWHWEGCAYVR